LYVGRKIALHYAAKENLKLEFLLEGSVFTNLTVRNLHAAPTGPSDVESIEFDLARVDYGLFTLLWHGISSAIENVDVRSARIVMNPAKAPLRPRPPNPTKKIELSDVFPERIHARCRGGTTGQSGSAHSWHRSRRILFAVRTEIVDARSC
jgi:hypothetical protein